MAGGINTPKQTAFTFRQASIALADSPTSPSSASFPSSSPTSTLPPSFTSSSTPDSSGQNITLVLVATPLGIAGIVFSIFAVITYVRRLRRARNIEAIDQESGKPGKKALELEVAEQPIEMGMKSPSIFELFGDIGMRHISGIRPSRTSGSPRVPNKDSVPDTPNRVKLKDEPMKDEVENGDAVGKVGLARVELKRSESIVQDIPDLGFRSPELRRPASTSGWVRNPGLRSPMVPKVSTLTGLP
jgi:hypothetical protein